MRLPMNTSLATLKPSGIRRINALAAQHPGCIALALGEPDFPTPDVISAEVTAALDRGDTHYPPNNGTVELRRAISAHMEKRNLAYGEDEIIVTCGATEALFAALSSILNPGDEVLVPTPTTRALSPRRPLACTRASSWPTTPKQSFWIRSLRNFRLTRMRFVLA